MWAGFSSRNTPIHIYTDTSMYMCNDVFMAVSYTHLTLPTKA